MPDSLLEALAKRNAMGMGNINLFSRPISPNPDGSISTINSVGIEEMPNPNTVNEVLVPGVDAHGKRLISGDEAADQYDATHEHLGKFSGPHAIEQSDMLGQALHKEAESGLTTPPLATSRKSVDPKALEQTLLWLLTRDK